MLFDLRGRGRRRTVQVIYLSLAVLMGGGLILFGIGGATSGGLIDAVTGNGSSKVDNSAYTKRVNALNAQVTADPQNAAAWAALAKAEVQQASIEGYDQSTATFTDKGVARLRAADRAWEKYLALNPKKPDDRVASLMVNAYGPAGLNDNTNAVKALETVITGRGGTAALYTQLATLAYLGGDTRKSTIAENRALELTPKAKRKLLQANIAAQRKQIDQAKQQQAQSQSSGTDALGN